MKEQKCAIWISAFATVISVCSAILLNILYVDFLWGSFFVNLSLSVLGGSCFALLISISSYKIHKKNTLENFIHETRNAIIVIQSIPNNLHELSYSEIYDTIQIVALHDEWELGCAYADIEFFFFAEKQRKRIYEEIYFPVHKILEVCQYYHRELKRVGTGSRQFARSLEKICFTRYETNGIRCIERNIDRVAIALNGWFFDLYEGKRQDNRKPLS